MSHSPFRNLIIQYFSLTEDEPGLEHVAVFFMSAFAVAGRFNEEVKHIKVVEKDNWIHITEAKKFESLLVGFCSPLEHCPCKPGRGWQRQPGASPSFPGAG